MASASVPAASSPSRGKKNDALLDELWNACARTTHGVPKEEEMVYYFPQGHMEQLQGTMNMQPDQRIPLYELPCKILCQVVNVSRMIEEDTDEVYAQITLQAIKQTEITNPVPNPPEKPRPRVHSFSKILTVSDTSTHGGLSVPRKYATESLPPLDLSQATPSQELVTKDFHGHEWRFKHIFRGEPPRHLISTGWSKFVNGKKLAASDEFVFVRGEDDRLLVGVRRSSRKKPPVASPVLSPQSLNLAVVATARHAINGLSIFSVYYKPSASSFIIGVNKCLKAMGHAFHVGMHVQTNEYGEYLGYTGTIVEVGDFSSQWPGSQWRSLKVQWDEPSGVERLPERVSPWEVEPLGDPPYHSVPLLAGNKRMRSPQGSDAVSSSDAARVHNESNLGGNIRKSSLPHLNAPLKLFPDLAESSKAVLWRSLYSGPVPPDNSSGRSNGQKDKQKVNENPSNFRLFGFDITGNDTNASNAPTPHSH